MSFNFTLILTFLGLTALIVLVTLVMKRFGIRSFSISFGLGHLLFIAAISILYLSGSRDAQHQLFWIPVATVDLPVSLLAQVLAPYSMTLYIVLLALLGSAQYAVIGWAIDFKLSRDRKSLIPNKFYLALGAFVIIGISFWAARNISYLKLNDYEKSEIALKEARTERDRFKLLGDAAKASFKFKKYEKAREFSEELLAVSVKYKDDRNYYGDAIYHAHIVLGRLELLSGRSEQAIHHLSEAIKTPGSPVLASFGPDMSLARDLLEKGYKEPVIEFLIECKRVWKYNDGKIETWIKDISEGKMPDFGNMILE